MTPPLSKNLWASAVVQCCMRSRSILMSSEKSDDRMSSSSAYEISSGSSGRLVWAAIACCVVVSIAESSSPAPQAQTNTTNERRARNFSQRNKEGPIAQRLMLAGLTTSARLTALRCLLVAASIRSTVGTAPINTSSFVAGNICQPVISGQGASDMLRH